ncbi:MAG TPA: FCD domain-containing protein [Sporichthya sp.]|nr:FCD domain-containing protein [Sporichthya sp.]
MQRWALGARSAVFAPLDTVGRAELVAGRLADAILLGLLADEEQLPSEADLSAQLAVSTVTVREALTMLRERGLVETRRGRGGGSFVRAPADDPAAELRERLSRVAMIELRDLFDHYAAVGGTAARLAAERASTEDVERLQRAADMLTVAKDAGARRRAEGYFHLEIAAAAQSARLTRAELALQGELGALLWLPFEGASVHRRAAAQHREIIAAITAGDGARARDLIERHIMAAAERVTELRLQLLT